MSAAEATSTRASVSLTRNVDGSLRELSDEELEQIAGGTTFNYVCCGFSVTVQGGDFSDQLAAADEAHDTFGCGD